MTGPVVYRPEPPPEPIDVLRAAVALDAVPPREPGEFVMVEGEDIDLTQARLRLQVEHWREIRKFRQQWDQIDRQAARRRAQPAIAPSVQRALDVENTARETARRDRDRLTRACLVAEQQGMELRTQQMSVTHDGRAGGDAIVEYEYMLLAPEGHEATRRQPWEPADRHRIGGLVVVLVTTNLTVIERRLEISSDPRRGAPPGAAVRSAPPAGIPGAAT